MRHFLSHVLLGILAFFLIAFSALFAWVRSSQYAITTSNVVLEHRVHPAEEQPAVFHWEEIGARSYMANCRNCHGAGGGGWDQYPALHDSGRIVASDGGREYMVDLHLYGLTSDRWQAPMPALGTMADAEIAAVINHMLAEFGETEFDIFTPEEVAARRGRNLSPSGVDSARPSLDAPPDG